MIIPMLTQEQMVALARSTAQYMACLAMEGVQPQHLLPLVISYQQNLTLMMLSTEPLKSDVS